MGRPGEQSLFPLLPLTMMSIYGPPLAGQSKASKRYSTQLTEHASARMSDCCCACHLESRHSSNTHGVLNSNYLNMASSHRQHSGDADGRSVDQSPHRHREDPRFANPWFPYAPPQELYSSFTPPRHPLIMSPGGSPQSPPTQRPLHATRSIQAPLTRLPQPQFEEPPSAYLKPVDAMFRLLPVRFECLDTHTSGLRAGSVSAPGTTHPALKDGNDTVITGDIKIRIIVRHSIFFRGRLFN
jgi:hypothetical protein